MSDCTHCWHVHSTDRYDGVQTVKVLHEKCCHCGEQKDRRLVGKLVQMEGHGPHVKAIRYTEEKDGVS